MPVRFQGKSEYDHKFQWHDSFKSASFTPSYDQEQSSAGSPSANLGHIMEPPLQRKKRVGPANKTETITSMDDETPTREEYVLLGNQSKFNSNVKYKIKPPTKASVKGDATPSQVLAAQRSPPPAPRGPPPPPPKVYVDTGARHLRPQPNLKVPEVKSQATNTQIASSSQTHGQSHQRKEEKSHTKKEGVKLKEAKKADVLRVRNEQGKKIHQQIAPRVSKKEPKKASKQSPGTMNEFVQTDLAHGVADSGQEAGKDYALKYKTGIAPPRGRGPKRLSEYQLQFKWKDGIKSSPLLAAEQLVYKSNPAVVPAKGDRMDKGSEYQKQFKPWKTIPVPPNNKEETPKKKLKRSKSLEAISPDQKPAAGKEKVTTQEDKRLLQHSMNTLKLHFPHGRLRNYNSEYAMNFKAPWKYEYEDGAWRGADPPHLEPKLIEDVEMADDMHPPASAASSWFQEVRELRQKAAEYKLRARGTHFSREHMAQLYAKQSEMWDTISNSDVLSALDLELEAGQKVVEEKKVVKKSDKSKKKMPAKKKAWDDDSMTSGSRTITPRSSIANAPSDATWDETDRLYVNHNLDADEGRIPTPKIRASQQYIRHHLDRTTPAVGGALLTSPPGRSKAPEGSPSEQSQDSEAYDMTPVITKPNHHDKKMVENGSESSRSDQSGSTTKAGLSSVPKHKTYGMPTRDTHVLVDEEASVDRPLLTDYVHTPEKNKAGRRAREKFPNVAIPDTIKEDGGATFNQNKKPLSHQAYEVKLDDIPWRGEKDDDILSMSVRSVASSCSLASETLERARQRRDYFWGESASVSTR